MDNKASIGELLHSHGLKRTPIRVQILEIFMDHDFALSASDLIASTEQDRVTIYRALSSFEERGILHKASIDVNGAKYALCNHNCPGKPHPEKHAHFICEICHHTFCIENLNIPDIRIPDKFKVKEVKFILSGICEECKN
jgi:Fur family ferric uptake transcriptional regulator